MLIRDIVSKMELNSPSGLVLLVVMVVNGRRGIDLVALSNSQTLVIIVAISTQHKDV